MKISLKPGEAIRLSNRGRNEIMVELPEDLSIETAEQPVSEYDARVNRTKNTLLKLLPDQQH